MQLPTLYMLIDKTQRAVVIIAGERQDHGHFFSHKKEFCPWPKKSFSPSITDASALQHRTYMYIVLKHFKKA